MNVTTLVGTVLLALALAAAFGAQMLRWLRVLQREHYEPAAMHRFVTRWSLPTVASANSPERSRRQRPISLTVVMIALALFTMLAHQSVLLAVVSVAYGLTCPQGLGIKGRTSALQWTRRLRTVAALATVVALLLAGLAVLTREPWFGAVIAVWGVPVLLAGSAKMLEPYERRKAQTFVDQASKRLARVQPLVVGITGSYGKTSTKNHLADLLSGDGGVVATPRSFNNRAGLSRAINEQLADGTRVFIAEMGTYGPGEIAELCAWCPPTLAVITALGPVHLERMKSLDVIEAAKFELVTTATTVVVNVDDPRLARWPERLGERRVRRAGSTSPDADVRVAPDGGEWVLEVDGAVVTRLAPLSGVMPTNLACAVAAALELGATVDSLATRLTRVGAVANRANVVTAPSGVVVIDDTFNANPESARRSLDLLRGLDVSGRRVVVTPGLIELGEDQYLENATLAKRVGVIGGELVVVNRTNAKALLEVYGPTARRFNHREDAVAWVRSSLAAGDAVLYLNDLPDHYP